MSLSLYAKKKNNIELDPLIREQNTILLLECLNGVCYCVTRTKGIRNSFHSSCWLFKKKKKIFLNALNITWVERNHDDTLDESVPFRFFLKFHVIDDNFLAKELQQLQFLILKWAQVPEMSLKNYRHEKWTWLALFRRIALNLISNIVVFFFLFLIISSILLQMISQQK